MNDADDTGRRRRPPEPAIDDEPEMVDEDEVLLVGGTEELGAEQEESTGRFQVPEHVFRDGQAAGEDPPLLDEDAFEEDTSELDARDFFSNEAGAQDTGAAAEEPPAAGQPDTLDEDAGDGGELDELRMRDTLDEPLSPRKRRRRRQSQPLPHTEPGAPAFEQPAEQWPEDTATPAGEEPAAAADFSDSAGTAPGAGLTDSAGEEAVGDEAPWNQQPAAGNEATAILQAEGDGQEKTLIFGQEQEQQQVFPILVVVQGEEEGREIELIPDHVTVGRGADNDLVFPDIACSRRHAVIQRQGDVLSIADLGSGNGTLVNGERIQQVQLQDGDEIQIGTTVVQVVWPVAAGAGGRGPGSTVTSERGPLEGIGGSTWLGELLADPRRRKLLVFGGGGVVGLLLVLLIVKLASGSGEPPAPSPEQLRQQQQQQQQQAFDVHFKKVKTYIDEMKWQEAALEVQLGLKIKPRNSLLLEYKAFVEKQLRAQAALKEAAEFLARDDLPNAILAARRVDPDSKYAEQARQLIEECRHKSVQQVIAAGKQLLEKKQLAQALLKFEEALEMEPQNEEAIQLREQVQRTLDAEQRRLARRRKRPKHTRRVKRQRPRVGVTGQILAFYKNGELDRAIGKAEEVGARDALVKLKKFKAVFERSLQLAKNQGQAKKAIEFLLKARKLDRAISGGQGQYQQTINQKLAKMSFILGVDAYMSKRYPQAYQYFVQAKRLGQEKANAHLANLEKLAKKMFHTAYILAATKPDEARSNLEIVVKILPPDHVYYGKAKKLLARLSGPGGSSVDDEGGF